MKGCLQDLKGLIIHFRILHTSFIQQNDAKRQAYTTRGAGDHLSFPHQSQENCR
jgi:hypothetical protein